MVDGFHPTYAPVDTGPRPHQLPRMGRSYHCCRRPGVSSLGSTRFCTSTHVGNDRFEKALLTTDSNAHRFQIIDQLQQSMPDGFTPPFSTWFDSKRDQALSSLKPVNSNDIPYIVSAASALGALPKLRDVYVASARLCSAFLRCSNFR